MMMLPASGLLQVRNRQACDVEGAGDIDRDHRVPRIGVDRLDRRSRTANAGIVDEDIEPAEDLDRRGDHRFDVRSLGVVTTPVKSPGTSFRASASACSLISVMNTVAPADENARAISRPIPDAAPVTRTLWLMTTSMTVSIPRVVRPPPRTHPRVVASVVRYAPRA